VSVLCETKDLGEPRDAIIARLARILIELTGAPSFRALCEGVGFHK
jgi:hypothetical protein